MNTPKTKAPLRAIVDRGAGSDQLECGHIVNHRPYRQVMARCEQCGRGQVAGPAKKDCEL